MILLVNSRGELPLTHSRSQAGAWEWNVLWAAASGNLKGEAFIAAFLARDKERDIWMAELSAWSDRFKRTPFSTY